MQSFMSAKEIAEKWNISQRRVSILCSERRIDGAMMVGNMWIIPSNAKKPIDKRITKHEKDPSIILKPFVKWVGGKGQLIKELEKILATCNKKQLTKYCEPFVGGGALLFYILTKYDFKELYISDKNQELINTYNVIKNDVESLIKELKALQLTYLSLDDNNRKVLYYSIRDKFNAKKLSCDVAVEKATYFIFLNKTCFNGLYRVNRNGQFNVPMGSYKSPTICDTENLLNINKALQNVTITCGDYSQSINFIDDKTFVYLDPPYRPISKTSTFTSYNLDIFDDAEQIRLAQFVDKLNAKGAKVVLSNSDPKNTNPEDYFFDDLYKNYNIERVSASRMINSNASNRGKIKELLISN